VAVNGERRPSPEALLEAARREERSHLKVFVGAAPGVGKTYAMLQAARERTREGVDVVVGVVETHGRRETEALVEGLEVVPRARLDHRGQTLVEMDLDAILARRPELVLVDELAHTNAPGSRHAKRFADVEELLHAGIDVYSTMNVQHVESLNDVVAQITGVRVRETVPDRILDRADEVQLIDLSPEELLQRLREGKVYVPAQAERAIRHFFQPQHLTALRELALRETAEHVDEQVQAYRRARAIGEPWAVSERVLVGVSGGAISERLVRAARRMADRRGAPWVAIFIETPRWQHRPEAEREQVARALRLAEQLGGAAVTLAATNVADELVRYAREQNVREIILGKSHRPWWRDLWDRSPIERVLRASGEIDVRVVSVEQERGEPPAAAAPQRTVSAPRSAWRAGPYLVAAAAVAAAAACAAGLMAVLPLEDPGMVFLAAVMVAAVVGGLGPSIFASVAGLLTYDYLFVEPEFTFTVTKPHDLLSLVAFLVVAVITSQLMSRIRDQAESSRRREVRTAALYAFARDVAAAAGIEPLLETVVDHVSRACGGSVVVLLPDTGRLVPRAAHPSGVALTDAERGAATWVWEHDQPAGRGTDTLAGSTWYHLPLSTVRGPVGVLSLEVGEGRTGLPLEQRQLLEALARQAAVGIERCRIDVVLEAHAKTEAIIESIEDGLVVLDQAGTVVHVNEVACAILEVERREALGRPFASLGTDHPHYLRLRGAIADVLARPRDEHPPVELALFLRGRDHHYVLRPTPFRARDGSPAGLILVLQDVTYLRDQERRREQLVATLSHELRTPLAALRMGVELLGRELLGHPAAADLLASVRDDTGRLEDVTQRLLDLSRSRATSIPLEREPVDVGQLADRVASVFALQAEERGVTIAVDAPPAPLVLPGDVTKLTWALSNLVANALRYTSRGGEIRIEAGASDGQVHIAVADTGPGIPPALRERIFERFVQGDRPGSAGLGLAIVRDIVQAHGGRILLDSELGKGTRFTLELPAG